ncbi:Protein of unknown function [Gryllus bimaculatus]|nr:Protein of unknown function [Gryllus bimaculatus]
MAAAAACPGRLRVPPPGRSVGARTPRRLHRRASGDQARRERGPRARERGAAGAGVFASEACVRGRRRSKRECDVWVVLECSASAGLATTVFPLQQERRRRRNEQQEASASARAGAMAQQS